MGFISEKLKMMDIFSSPYQFTLIDNQKQKKTVAGGFFSFIVICVLLGYFVYLCQLYFSSKINPSISQTNELYDSMFTFNITNDLFAFRLNLQNGQTIQELDKSTGLLYLNIIPTFNYIDESGANQQKNLAFTECQDPTLSSFVCLDFTNAGLSKTQFAMTFDPDNIGSYSIGLLFITRNPLLLQEGQKCATDQEIRENILRIKSYGVMRMTTSQYNSKTQRFEKNVKQEIFGFQEGLSYKSTVILQKSTTTITEGILFQNESETVHLSGYQRQESYATSQYIKEELYFNVVSHISIYLGQNGTNQQIQFPPFTSILAQFSSVMNTLLISGVIMQIFASNQIVQDLINIELKTYFKKTALNFIQKFNKSQDAQEQPSIAKRLVQTYISLQNLEIERYFNKYFQISLLQRFKLFLIGDEVKKEDSDQLKKYKYLLQETSKQMSIFEMQKQLLQVKLMLRILFSAEQFAALQLCGIELFCQNQDEQLKNIILNNEPSKDPKNIQKFNLACEDKQQTYSEKSQKEKKPLFSIGEADSPNLNFNGESTKLNKLNADDCNFDLQQINLKEQQIQSSNQESMVIQKNVNFSKFKETNNVQYLLKNQITTQNHLEKIDLIEKDLDYFEIYLEKFLDKNYIKSELDNRILNCMIGIEVPKGDIEIR